MKQLSYLLSVKLSSTCKVLSSKRKNLSTASAKHDRKSDNHYNWITCQTCSLDGSKPAFRTVEVFTHRVFKSDTLVLSVFSLSIVFVLSDKVPHDVR